MKSSTTDQALEATLKTIKLDRQCKGHRPGPDEPSLGESQVSVLEGLQAIFHARKHPGFFMVMRPNFEYIIRYALDANDMLSPIMALTIGSPDHRIATLLREFLDLHESLDRDNKLRKLFIEGLHNLITAELLRASLLAVTGHTQLTPTQLMTALHMPEDDFLAIMAMAIEDGQDAAPLFEAVPYTWHAT